MAFAEQSSKIISLLTQDVERVGAIVKGILMLCVNSILIGIVGGFLFFTSLQIMLAASLSLGIFYLILFIVFRRAFRESGKNRTYNFQQSVKVLQESLGGIREIILGKHYDLFVDTYDYFNRQRLLNDSGILIKATIPRYLVEGFLIILITGIALFYVLMGNELNNLLPSLGHQFRCLQINAASTSMFYHPWSTTCNQSSLEKLLDLISVPSSSVSSSKNPLSNVSKMLLKIHL